MSEASRLVGRPPLLHVESVSKTFAGQKALSGVSLSIEPGQIHALVGQNGSGKSTLIKILAGYHEADPGGRILVAGEEWNPSGPHKGRRGIGFVHQDLALIPTLGTLDNIAIGRGYARNRLGNIAWRREAASCRKLLAQMGAQLGRDIDIDVPVGELSPVERTCVAVARALAELHGDARLLVLDEPTASLPRTEAERLFAVLRSLRNSGAGILYVSHHLEEVLGLADQVTVLRDARAVHTGPAEGMSHNELVEHILGRRPPELSSKRDATLGASVLAAKAVTGGARRTSFSLEVSEGEILGIAGIDGSGREDVCRLLFGAEESVSGRITVAGVELQAGNPHAALCSGMSYVPADRHRDGLVMTHTVRENVTLPQLAPVVGMSGLRSGAERRDAAKWTGQVQLSPPNTETEVARLSGGNQQKVVLAKALRTVPSVLILDEPTQAVDIGAAGAIVSLVMTSARNGCAVVLASVDPHLLAACCHRVLVFRNGEVAAELSGSDVTADRIAGESIRSAPRVESRVGAGLASTATGEPA